MKRSHSVVGGLLPAFLLLFPPLVRAELVCPEPVAAAGELRSGLYLARRFVVRNTGTSQVTITDARPSCGCLKPRLEKRRLQPGEEGSILIEVNTLTQAAGPQQWRVLLHYRDGETQHELPLYVTATLQAELVLEPAALHLNTTGACRHQLTLTEYRPLPLNVHATQTSHPELHVQVQEAKQLGPGQWRRIIQVEATEAFPEGKHDVLVQLFSEDAEYRELKIPVGVVKRSKKHVQATPDSVSFVGGDARMIPARIVLLNGADEQPVEVSKVEADNPAIQCRWAQGPGAMTTLKIQFDPGPMQKSFQHYQVFLNKPEGDQISIPVRWNRE